MPLEAHMARTLLKVRLLRSFLVDTGYLVALPMGPMAAIYLARTLRARKPKRWGPAIFQATVPAIRLRGLPLPGVCHGLNIPLTLSMDTTLSQTRMQAYAGYVLACSCEHDRSEIFESRSWKDAANAVVLM